MTLKTKQFTTLDAKSLSDIAIQGLQEVKARDIVRMDLRKSNGAVTDYFIICTGTSDTHIQALAESVREFIKRDAREYPLSTEGMRSAEWVLMDYVNVVVHIFRQEKREFYRLENLWGDAPVERIAD